MQPCLSNSKNLKPIVLSFFIFCLPILAALSAAGQCPGPGLPCPPLSDGSSGGYVMCRIHKVQANINPWIHSYMEITPPDYFTNPTRKYPLLVYLGGTGEMFQAPNSNTVELCPALYWSMPSRINSGQFPYDIPFNGKNYSYFVVMPFADTGTTHYWDPIDPGAMIDYALAHYPGRIDASRIYVTGMSRGTENIMGWLTSSVTNAHRIAAAFIVANCYSNNLSDYNTRVSNLVAGGVHIWGLSCSLDQICSPTMIQAWVNSVNALSPGHALYTSYTDPPPPSTIVYCPGGYAGYHYAWNFAYSPAENKPVETGGKNPYEWMIQFSQNVALPVTIKDWSATLDRGKVLLEWTTSQEFNTKDFLIQRATAAGDFRTILSVPAAIGSSTDKKYSLVDNSPNPGENLYRLVEEDMDGKQQMFAVKRVVVPGAWTENVIIPNPVNDGVASVYVRVTRSQLLTIRLIDLNGRVIHQQIKQVMPGESQYTFNVTALQKGTYVIQLNGDEIKTSKKITLE